MTESSLPPGQVERKDFPRFGLTWFAHRFPVETECIAIQIAGDVDLAVETSLATLPRVEQVSNFHCVTSWSKRSLRWRGIRFRDFYEQIVVAQALPKPDATFVVFIGQDGYCNSLPLEDLLADDVMLADHFDGLPLTMEHGAPVRLVAPAHYGYKNVKHVSRIEFWCDDRRYHFPGPGLMEHRRARVALQERGKYLPGWLYRFLYRPVIGVTAGIFRYYSNRYYRYQHNALKAQSSQ